MQDLAQQAFMKVPELFLNMQLGLNLVDFIFQEVFLMALTFASVFSGWLLCVLASLRYLVVLDQIKFEIKQTLLRWVLLFILKNLVLDLTLDKTFLLNDII